MYKLNKLDADIKTIARCIIQNNEKRKKRIENNKASAFDLTAAKAVEAALSASCENIENIQARQHMQEQIYKSIVYNMPYEHLDTLCGRRQFYEYRAEFTTKVASAMNMLTRKEKKQ